MQEASRSITRILRLKEVETRTGLSRSSIYAYVKKGVFPSQVQLGPRSVGWIQGEVEAWLCEKCDAPRQTPILRPDRARL